MTIATATPATDVDTFNYAATGKKIATAVYGEKNVFLACQYAFVASEAGADHASIAKATAKALVEASGDESKSFSRQAVDQRVTAYGLVASRLSTPVPAVVAKAYTLSTKSTAAAEIAKVEAAFTPSGDDKADAEALMSLIVAGIKQANTDKKAKAQTGNVGDETTDEEAAEGKSTVEETFDSAEEVAAYITAQASRVWESADRQLILDAMAVFAAATN
jgi:hypothetical protein